MGFAIVEAPSVLGLFPSGVERLPDALLGAGLAERLGARRAGRVEPPPWEPTVDPATGMRNPHAIAAYSAQLADAVAGVIDAGDLPVVLGGDCSVVLGCLLARRRRGRSGLLFVDGHADFYQPEAEPNGEAASMDLALATGRGPAAVTDIEGRVPLVLDEDVVALGRRDAEEAAEAGSQRIEDAGIEVVDLAAVRRDGARASVERALERVARPELDGFWVHVDADVLDDEVMPAVDYRLPGGLAWDELGTVLASAAGTGRMSGLDLAIFNPALDADGSIATRLADTLAEALLDGPRA